jgi:glyoxylase I family protein
MPALEGFSHVSFSVRDCNRSRHFYEDTFGFAVIEELHADTYDEWILVHPAGMVVCLQQHQSNAGEPFDPVRTGADHLAFRVAERAELDEWVEQLARLGVRHSPVVERDYGAVLCLRDPDDIQLELFWRRHHP